jgi:predicted TIM-barrel fold metal-dependent hydrolase
VKTEDLIIVSVDDHIVEPPDMFERHVPAAYKNFAPRYEINEKGDGFWLFEDRKVANVGLNAVVGRPPEEYGMEPTAISQMRDAVYDVHKRVDDMNANGILGSLNFGTFAGFDGGFFRGARDKKLSHIMVQAYNDWHIDEWCGAYPGRFIPMAILPIWDVALMVEEIERVVKKGCHAVSFSDNPNAKGLPSIHNPVWEPFWKACAENNVIINCHIGTGTGSPHSSMESPIGAWLVTCQISVAPSAADWLQLSALQRYPSLKIALSEGGIGWIPYFLERADFTYDHHKMWTNADYGGKLPSEVFKEHFITCFIDDKFGVKNRDAIGVDMICYECDYPHADCVWPKAPELLMESFGGVPDEEIDKITHLNAMRHYSYDPFAVLGRGNCTVGALRAKAKNVDTTPKSYGGNRPVKEGDKRVVTSGDVVKLFMEAGAKRLAGQRS